MQTPPTNRSDKRAEGFSLSIDDVFFILFRHKWKILISAAAGVVAAAVLLVLNPPVYISRAKLLVLYVLENKTTAPNVSDPQMRSPDYLGMNILNSEVEILTSFDLALRTVDAIGPERILAHVGGGTNRQAAAAMIVNGLDVTAPKGASVIQLSFSHRDRTVVQPVLSGVIEAYRQRHVEIHQGGAVREEVFSKKSEAIRTRLAQMDEELGRLKREAGVGVSLEDTKKGHGSTLYKIQEDILANEAELASRTSLLQELKPLSGTNVIVAAPVAPETDISPETASNYKDIRARLDSYQRQRNELPADWTEEHPLVQRLQERISEANTKRREMEREFPALASLSLPRLGAGTNSTAVDVASEESRVKALEARIKKLNEQLEKVTAEAEKVAAAEPQITQLERTRELEQARLRFYSSGLEQNRDDESSKGGEITNISTLQNPSPPGKDLKRLYKPLGGVLAVGMLGGLVLAFLIDLVLDRSVKRPSDIERRLGLKLFLTIPDWARNGRSRWSFGNGKRSRASVADAPQTGAAIPEVLSANGWQSAQGNMELAPWDSQHPLDSYFEALRDRLITFFEVRNMTHKPKLVGVTSCHRGAGVTTMAAGLAASLSETGDGNVLLVDMNTTEGAAYPFHGGKPGCGLSEVLQTEKPDNSLVQERLYLASAHEVKGNELPKVLPKRFAHLVPQMKASDFDYIIFDLPAVAQTSVTPRLSGFMDMVVMVVESEKTGQEALKQAMGLLEESGATAAPVLNKNHKYVPPQLSQEL